MKKEADNNRQNPTDRRFRVIPVILAAKNISEGVKAAEDQPGHVLRVS